MVGFRFFRFPISLVGAILIYLFIRGVITGDLFQPTQIEEFNVQKAITNFNLLTQSHRLVESKGAKATMRHFFESISSLVGHGGNCQFSIRKEQSNYTVIGPENIYQYQPFVDTFVLELNPSEKEFQTENNQTIPLIFSAHYDSHTVGPSTYDDGINIAAMLELAHAIYRNPNGIHRPVYFFFLGSEEWGMHGSRIMAEKLHEKGIKAGYFFNLEALGVGRPFALITRSKFSYSILKAWARTPDSVSATFVNDIYNLGIIDSYSDAQIYEKAGFHGAQSIFMGNPALYHTALDDLHKNDDMIYLGQQLYQFWENFDALSKKGQANFEDAREGVAFGIHPFVICLPKAAMKSLSYTLILISLSVIVFRFYRKQSEFKAVFPAMLRAGFGYISSFSLCTTLSIFVNKINPLSFCDHQMLFFCALVFICGLLLMVVSLSSFTSSSNQGWLLLHLLIHLLLLALTATADFAAFFFAAVATETLQFALYNSVTFSKLPSHQTSIVRTINQVLNTAFSFVSLLPACFTYGVIHSTLFGITANMPKSLGALVFIASGFFALEIVVSLLSSAFIVEPQTNDGKGALQVDLKNMKKDGMDEDEKPKKRDRTARKAERFEEERKRLKQIAEQEALAKLEGRVFYFILAAFLGVSVLYTGYLAVKSPPFTVRYPLKGPITHVYESSQKPHKNTHSAQNSNGFHSTVSFMPVAASPVRRSVRKAMLAAIAPHRNITFVENYQGLLNNGDALVQRYNYEKETMPPFLEEWPQFAITSQTIMNKENPGINKRRVKIFGKNISKQIEQAVFMFRCKKGEDCVTKLPCTKEGEKVKFYKGRVAVRELPLPNNFEFELEVQGPPVQTEIMFISSKHTKELDYFRYSLEDYVQCYAKDRLILDTVLKNSTTI